MPARDAGDVVAVTHRLTRVGSALPPRWRRRAVDAGLEVEFRAATARLRRRRTAQPQPDLVVAAFAGETNGITRGAQLQYEALRRAGVPVRWEDGGGPTRAGRDPAEGATYVLHCGARETARLLNAVRLPRAALHTVGYWAWELPDPPPEWARYQSLVSEVWTPSTFCARSLSSLFDVPVHVVPHRVAPQPARRRDPSRPFTVLTMADSRSSFARKNPAAAVAAFRAAFGDRTDVRLVVKLLGRPAEVAGLRRELGAGPNVEVLTRRLDLTELDALLRSADVLVSLHRAEGFGLPLLEAMARGVPVVATGWSGNVDFMDEANGLLVPYRLVDVRDPAGVYRARSRWADPDVDAAASMLRALEADEGTYRTRAAAAHAAVCALPTVTVPGRDAALRTRPDTA